MINSSRSRWIYALLLTATAASCPAQWSSDPAAGLLIEDPYEFQTDVRAFTDQAGGAIVSYLNLDIFQGTGFTRLNKVSGNGEIAWQVNTNANAVNSRDLVQDGAGGAYLGWSVTTSSLLSHVVIQRYSSAGVETWGPEGIRATTTNAAFQLEEAPDLALDNNNNLLVAWSDRNQTSPTLIRAQKFSPDGSRLWGPDGVRVSTRLDVMANPSITTDGAGGAIISWVNSVSGGETDIYAQRINSAGNLTWGSADVPVCISTGNQTDVQALPDGASGAVIAWVDARSAKDIYVQRMDGAGNALWAANGVKISTNSAQRTSFQFQMINNVPFISSVNMGSPLRFFIQKLNLANGQRMWTDSGKFINDPTGTSGGAFCDDGAGGLIVTWNDSRNGSLDIYAQRLNSVGLEQWQAGGVPVSTASRNQSVSTMLATGQGKSIVVWTDTRNSGDSNDNDIYCAYLEANGILRGLTAAKDWQLWD